MGNQCAEYDMVRIRDGNGQDVVRYLKLCEGRYFGGNTWDRADGFAGGIHEMRWLNGMLDLIGQVANMPLDHPGLYYEICSNRQPPILIRREMNAVQLAAILGCEEKDVCDHFAALISLAKEPDMQSP